MHTISSFITNPFAIIEGAFTMFEKASSFAMAMMQQSMEFASSIMRIVV
jgi:hypothetical protein